MFRVGCGVVAGVWGGGNILEGSIKQVLFCNFTLLKCAKLEQAMNVIAGDCSL